MRLLPVFIRGEFNDEIKDTLNLIAQSRPGVLNVSIIKTAINSAAYTCIAFLNY